MTQNFFTVPILFSASKMLIIVHDMSYSWITERMTHRTFATLEILDRQLSMCHTVVLPHLSTHSSASTGTTSPTTESIHANSINPPNTSKANWWFLGTGCAIWGIIWTTAIREEKQDAAFHSATAISLTSSHSINMSLTSQGFEWIWDKRHKKQRSFSQMKTSPLSSSCYCRDDWI